MKECGSGLGIGQKEKWEMRANSQHLTEDLALLKIIRDNTTRLWRNQLLGRKIIQLEELTVRITDRQGERMEYDKKGDGKESV